MLISRGQQRSKDYSRRQQRERLESEKEGGSIKLPPSGIQVSLIDEFAQQRVELP